MSDDIRIAKRRVPLPALMERLGLADHAKKSALCPFHEEPTQLVLSLAKGWDLALEVPCRMRTG